MSISIDVEKGQAQITQVVSSVFETMLGLKIDPIVDGYSPLKGEGFTASVQFMGEEKGLASLHCTVDQALRFTAAMLGEEPAEVNSDVWDVLSEIANMAGGNLNSLLAPGGSLSLPLVAQGKDYVQRLCEPSWTTTVGFASEFEAYSRPPLILARRQFLMFPGSRRTDARPVSSAPTRVWPWGA